jgi:hypothetical protein
MFGFLNSAALFAAAAALVPLLLHLFSRRRLRIVEFSSLKHLQSMQRRQVRRLKLRQWLLLLIRTLIILAIVFAFARPTLRDGAVGSHAPVTAVILLDNSESMNRMVTDGHLFDLAKRRTIELLEQMSEQDQALILTTVANTDLPQRFVSAATAMQLVESIAVSSGRAQFEAAASAATELLRDALSVNKELYLVTDRQQSMLGETIVESAEDIRVLLVDLPLDESDNVGLTSVSLGGQLILPGHEFGIAATVSNSSPRDRDDIVASVFLDGRRVSQTKVEVMANQEATLSVSRQVDRPGMHSGWVELSDDKFAADNRYFFSFDIPEASNLLVLSDDPSANLLALALSPSSNVNLNWSIKQAKSTDLPSVNIFEYDAIFMVGLPPLQRSQIESIEAFVRAGGGLFVCYSASTSMASFNSALSNLSGATITEPHKSQFSRAGYYTLDQIDVTDQLFAHFASQQSDLPSLRFYTLPKVSVSAEAATLASFSGNRPAVVQNTFGRGRVISFFGLISPEHSDIASHAFYVPFSSRIAELLVADLSSYDLSYFCGDQVSRTGIDLPAGTSALKLIAPDSSEYALAIDQASDDVVIDGDLTGKAGIYSIMSQGQRLDQFAVNMRPEEADLTSLDWDRVLSAIGAPNGHFLEYDTPIEAALAELRFGRELWQVFLWLVFVLIGAELLLARDWHKGTGA